jgi:uncharacterized membrane protein YgcG
VHVTRYRALTDLAGIPAEVTSALANQQLAVSTARGAAMAPVAPTAVVDAVKHVEAPVVQAWLLERGQGFAMLDAKQLVALADAGVPGSVTDLMVALTYPKQFAINHGGAAVSPTGTESASGNDVVTGRTIPVYVDTYGYSPFGWGPYGSYYSWYGYSPYYLPYGYGGYGYGYTGPIIITRPSDGSPSVASHPHVVRGQGYTEGRTSTPSSSTGSTRSSAGSSSSGSSSSSPSSSSSGASSSGGGRTAHRVP